jgi:hypothetical protein
MSENTNTTQTMLVVESSWNKLPSFRLVPLSKNAPFNEAIYDPGTGVLALISKEANDKPHMVDRLDENGFSIAIKGHKDAQGNAVTKKQRLVIPTYYEHYLGTQNDARAFLDQVAVNPTHPAVEAAFALNTKINTPITNFGGPTDSAESNPADLPLGSGGPAPYDPNEVNNLDAIETVTHTLPPVAGHADGSGIEVK